MSHCKLCNGFQPINNSIRAVDFDPASLHEAANAGCAICTFIRDAVAHFEKFEAKGYCRGHYRTHWDHSSGLSLLLSNGNKMRLEFFAAPGSYLDS